MSVPGFDRVISTSEERAEWHAREVKKYGRAFPGTPQRIQCKACGKRIWLGGTGIGSHRRACSRGWFGQCFNGAHDRCPRVGGPVYTDRITPEDEIVRCKCRCHSGLERLFGEAEGVTA